MKQFKYSFKKEEVEIIDTLPKTKYDSIVKLGYIVKEKGEYDEEGNEIKAPVLSNEYKVDVIWRSGKQPSEWEKYEIKEEINNVIHTFS